MTGGRRRLKPIGSGEFPKKKYGSAPGGSFEGHPRSKENEVGANGAEHRPRMKRVKIRGDSGSTEKGSEKGGQPRMGTRRCSFCLDQGPHTKCPHKSKKGVGNPQGCPGELHGQKRNDN